MENKMNEKLDGSLNVMMKELIQHSAEEQNVIMRQFINALLSEKQQAVNALAEDAKLLHILLDELKGVLANP